MNRQQGYFLVTSPRQPNVVVVLVWNHVTAYLFKNNIDETVYYFRYLSSSITEEKFWAERARAMDFLEGRKLKLSLTPSNNTLTEIKNKLTETENKFTDIKNKITETENKITETENKIIETENKITSLSLVDQLCETENPWLDLYHRYLSNTITAEQFYEERAALNGKILDV